MMKCESCNQEAAKTLKVTEIVSGKPVTRQLCAECAGMVGELPYDVGGILRIIARGSDGPPDGLFMWLLGSCIKLDLPELEICFQTPTGAVQEQQHEQRNPGVYIKFENNWYGEVVPDERAERLIDSLRRFCREPAIGVENVDLDRRLRVNDRDVQIHINGRNNRKSVNVSLNYSN